MASFSTFGYPIHLLLTHLTLGVTFNLPWADQLLFRLVRSTYIVIPFPNAPALLCGHLLRPNFSCHLPLLPVLGLAAVAATGIASSSTVSLMVDTTATPGAPSSGVTTGVSSISALEVFFWRSAQVLSGDLSRAEVSECSRVRLILSEDCQPPENKDT